MKPTTLSKSRFKLALECPTKVFYSLDDRYVNAKEDDEFLEALADGGFQVGALAREMYCAEDPDAIEVTTRDQDDQIRETDALLARENVTIFEGTIRHGNMLVRVDVLRKRGHVVELIEVKSKSYDPDKPKNTFRGAKGEIRSGWLPYMQDVAFQTYVTRLAYPQFQVRPFLLLVDPTGVCSLDGLGSAIRVVRHPDNSRHVDVTVEAGFDLTQLRTPLLKAHDVAREVEEIVAGLVDVPSGAYAFVDFAREMADKAAAGLRIDPVVSRSCKKCEFYCPPGVLSPTRRSGFAECIEQRFPGRGVTPREKTIFALYNHRKADELLGKGKLLLADCDETDVGDEESVDEIVLQHRHRLQIQEGTDGERATLLRKDTLRNAFSSWTFPLHFIDFETSRPTLPFTKGRRPNQQLLFQFSHHVLDAEGRLEHRAQCLVTEPGVVPNASVVRTLRDALGGDQGTVLHWWTHEKTVLKDVRNQLETSTEPDKDALIAFIGSLIDGEGGRPPRLVDMGLPLVSRTAFIAGTDGRSSIKKVLQAVLAHSDYLREKYGRPVYGTPEMSSLNFPAKWTWWQEGHGTVRDPYTLLGQLLGDPELDAAARAEEDEEASEFVANGGAAMMAYSELQQRDLPVEERRRIEGQLKRYCELDTLAMVMVYEALREWVRA